MYIKPRTPRVTVAVALALALATAAYTFAASNSVPPTPGREGSSPISGYTGRNVAYNLNASAASKIDSVTFTLSAGATTVRVSLVPGIFYRCYRVSGNDWTCPTTSPQATVRAATNLDVIAKDH